MKAVLVMEFPTSCGMCDLAYADEEGVNYTCCAMNCTLDSDIIIEQTKPTWCPLKPLPEKQDIKKAKTMTSLTWCEGFNACLDNITKAED